MSDLVANNEPGMENVNQLVLTTPQNFEIHFNWTGVVLTIVQ